MRAAFLDARIIPGLPSFPYLTVAIVAKRGKKKSTRLTTYAARYFLGKVDTWSFHRRGKLDRCKEKNLFSLRFFGGGKTRTRKSKPVKRPNDPSEGKKKLPRCFVKLFTSKVTHGCVTLLSWPFQNIKSSTVRVTWT